MAKSNTITYSCRVLPEVAQLMKKISVERGLSQAKVLAMALRCLTESNADHTQENTDNAVFELLKEELKFKNNEIDRLLNAIDQQNQLLGMASKKELLLIEEQKPVKMKQNKKESEVDRTSSKEGSITKKDKSRFKKSKKRGKKKK